MTDPPNSPHGPDGPGGLGGLGGPGQRRSGRVGTRRRRSRAEAGPPPTRGPQPLAVDAKGPIEPPGVASGQSSSPDTPPDIPRDASLTSAAGAGEATARNEPPGRNSPEAASGSAQRRGGGRRARPEPGPNPGGGRDGGRDGPWRELTGSGRSQVSQAAAMRARDADRPTEADLAEAERDVVIQRRNWTPGG